MKLATAPASRRVGSMSPLLVPRPYRVLDRTTEAPDTYTMVLAPIGFELPAFRPAQVSMLGAFGVGEAAISISSALDKTDSHAYTIRRAGAITSALVDTPVGGVVTVRGPFGQPWPLESVETANVAVIAGGLGIAPLRTLLCELIDRSSDAQSVSLAYGVRSPDDLIYGADLERWSGTGAAVAVTVDRPHADWNGPVGLVAELMGAPPPNDDRGQAPIIFRGIDPDWGDTTAFVCGPDVMMRGTAEKLVSLGVPPERIWLTIERNMQCGNALCGHCQLGPIIVCRDGPVVNYAEVSRFLGIEEL